MRFAHVRAAALAGVLLLAGDAGDAPAPDSTTSGAASPSSSVSVAALIGTMWRVEGAAGEPDPTWARFTSTDVTLFRPKGFVDFTLAAQGTELLTSLESWSMTLGRRPAAPWLTSTASFARHGAGWRLLDASGRTTATLVEDGGPAANDQYDTSVAPPTAADLQRLRPATPGAGAAGLTAAELTGTWHVSGYPDATATFTATTWSAHPTCASGSGADGGGGALRLLPDGTALLTSGAVAGVGCSEREGRLPEGAVALEDLWQARSFRVAGDRLTVYDVHGRSLGVLTRS